MIITSLYVWSSALDKEDKPRKYLMETEKVFELADKPLWDFHNGLMPQDEDKNKDGSVKKHFLRMRKEALKIIIKASSNMSKHKTLGSWGWFSIHYSYLYGGNNDDGKWISGVMGKPLALRFLDWLQRKKIFVIDATIASYVSSPSDPLKGHTTKGWKLTNETQQALHQFRKVFSISEKHKILPDLTETAILDLRKDGEKRKSEVQIPKWIMVDTKKMIETYGKCIITKKIAGNIYDTKQIKLFGLEKEDLDRLWNTYAIAELNRGFLPQEYEEYTTGRLWGKTFYSFQLMPRRMLPYIIPKTWDYDFEACHPTLLVYLSKKVDSKIKTPTLNKYLRERKIIRQKISKEIGSNVDRVKRAINALGYDAPMKCGVYPDKETEENKDYALQDILGDASCEKFIKNKLVLSINTEMDECKKIILNHSPYIQNCPPGMKRSSKISFILNHKERELLEIMIREIQKQNVPIIALMHDGIIIKNKIEEEKITNAILKETGIQIKLDRKQIQ